MFPLPSKTDAVILPRKGKVARPQAETDGDQRREAPLSEPGDPTRHPSGATLPVPGRENPTRSPPSRTPAKTSPSRGGVDPRGRDFLAIGVGFRKRCAPDTLTALVREARDRLTQAHPALADAPAMLATIAEKDRPALREAADTLGLAILVLPKGALLGTEDRITVASAAARACFGLPSVAEAAALAAAGPGARLVLSRISVADATCAIASTARSASESP